MRQLTFFQLVRIKILGLLLGLLELRETANFLNRMRQLAFFQLVRIKIFISLRVRDIIHLIDRMG